MNPTHTQAPTALRTLAQVVRSKNTGPTLLTLGLFFNDGPAHERAAASAALRPDAVVALYGVAPQAVQRFLLPQLHAIKFRLPARPVRRYARRWRPVRRAAARPLAGADAVTRATARLLQSHRPGGGPLRVLSASGQLGYGIPADALARGMARRPHFIGADMDSIDPGPYYLGSGAMAAPEPMVRRDLALVLQGALVPIGAMPAPDEADIPACSHIVGQCGTETFERVLGTDPDVVRAGRACDTAIFAALPELLGYPSGLALHMAKIIECTSLCCRPSERDAMLAELHLEGFTLESMNPASHAAPVSVPAHALYEQADPFSVEEPGGTLHLGDARYVAVEAHCTRVSGARFERRARPTLKVEGARPLGARAVPRHEAGLVIEFIAPDAELARTSAAVYKQNLLHHGYPGRVSTAGNLAFALTPSELDAHAAYGFVLYHVMHDTPLDHIFQIATHDIKAPAAP